MERLQGHFNSYFLDRKSDVKSLEFQGFAEVQSLQSEEPNFLTLFSLQNFKESWELESYLSQEDHPQFHSPIQSETKRFYQNSVSTPSMEGANQALSNQELPCNQANMIIPSSSSSLRGANSRRKHKISHLLPQETTREKRKRRKTKPTKNFEDIENQRRNHIAVERNRRLQMNEHINSLRSLLPPSYIQRGDQASIVEGAINYVKGLEQIIQTLGSQKRMQENNQETTNHLLSDISSNTLWTIHEDQSCVPSIEVTVIQNHVNLKVQCLKKQGQLLKGIITLEKLRLTVLHLSIVPLSRSSVSYSFNLKIEDDCDIESVDEIKKVAHQIFDIRLFP